ncbi:MAG: anti-sigma factor family protein [Candidatus Binatia bacterium]
MTCRHYRQLLSPYLDNVLTPAEHQGVLSHLSQCSACAEQLRQLESNRQLLRALPAAAVTGAMERRLQARVQSPKSKVQSLRPPTPNPRPLGAWWRDWRSVSVGTLATCAASLVLYFSTLQAPPEVSAEEVVSSMDQLLEVLDPDEGVRIITEEVEEEAAPDWQQEINQWFGDYENNEH